jgi:tetratricopeptide (TPR) repeat protein
MVYLTLNHDWVLLAGGLLVVGYLNSSQHKQAQTRSAVRKAQSVPDPQRVTQLERILATDPVNLEALISLASAKSRLGAWEDAQVLCRRALQIQSGNFLARWLLADAYFNTQLLDDALPLYESLLTATGVALSYKLDISLAAARGYRMKGDPGSALKALRLVDVQSAPHDEKLRSWLVTRALVKYTMGDEQSALSDIEWLEQNFPGAGVTTMKGRMLSGELRDVVGPNRAAPSMHVTECPVCGAPRLGGATICHFCNTAF